MNLNCMFHDGKPAVAQCVVCGVGLCKACAEKYEPIVCDKCASQVDKDEKKTAKRRIIIMIVVFVLTILLGIYGTISDTTLHGIARGLKTLALTPLMAWMFSGIPSGWRAGNKLFFAKTLDILLIIPLAGWALWFFFKVVLSAFVGIIAMPLELIKYIKLLKS